MSFVFTLFAPATLVSSGIDTGTAQTQSMETWRSEEAHDHSRVLALFAGADHGPHATTLIVQLEDETWQTASSWKGYCDRLAIQAACLGHESCLRVLHALGGDAAASLAAAGAIGGGYTPAHFAAMRGQGGCLRVLHELGGDAAASLVATDATGSTPAHRAATGGHEGCLRVLHELGGDAAASVAGAADDDH